MGEEGGSGAAALAAADEKTLEFTPTWIVAAVCAVMIFASVIVERLLHRLGKVLKREGQKALFEALLKLKEELMVLGFISLMLTVFEGSIQKICIPLELTLHMLPCKAEDAAVSGGNSSATAHYQTSFNRGFGGGRRLLSGSGAGDEHCAHKEKFPLLSLEAIHQLHIFIFALAVTHVSFCILTVIIGSYKLREWKIWEDSIDKEDIGDDLPKDTHSHQFQFIRDRFMFIGKDSMVLSWLHAFLKQFYGSVTKSDYITMRFGFITTHFKGNHKFDFHKYMIRTLEADFKKVVGISWYLWVFVIIFLLLNVNGWLSYFWLAFIPLILLLAVGTKLEHVITQLAHEVVQFKTCSKPGDFVIKPSDDHFWFNRPKIVLHLIHFILFQNSFEIAFFFWILITYGFNSCIMGQAPFSISRLIIGVVVQLLCSYSTLPLYAIVTQMGTTFKKEIFNEHVQEALTEWAKNAKKNKGQRMGKGPAASSLQSKESSPTVELSSSLAREDMELVIMEEQPETSEANIA